MRNIGIVCEGPTDYTILKEVIDHITGESNDYVQLQPEADLTGAYGNGWKGVWKWCRDNAACKEKLMRAVEPSLDLLIIQMDGEYKGKYHPLECDSKKEIRESCPIVLPCAEHKTSVNAYIRHLEQLIIEELQDMSDTCIVIPCDSTESWIVAAYDGLEDAEEKDDPCGRDKWERERLQISAGAPYWRGETHRIVYIPSSDDDSRADLHRGGDDIQKAVPYGV